MYLGELQEEKENVSAQISLSLIFKAFFLQAVIQNGSFLASESLFQEQILP